MRVENSFIGVEGVGERTERDLWAEGVTHWDAFEPSAVAAREDTPIGDTLAERIQGFIEEGQARLARDDAAYFDERFPDGERWRLYRSFRENACFFDIETTGLDQHRDCVTTVSWHRGGDTHTLVRGDDLTADALDAALTDAPLLVSYNGSRFDVPFLEASFDLDLDVPHFDLRWACERVDLTGGLKQVERQVGVDRESDIDGRQAVELWHQHERGVDGALETLVHYNREDAAGLREVADAVTDRLHESVRPADCTL